MQLKAIVRSITGGGNAGESALPPMGWLMRVCGDNVADFWGSPQDVETFVRVLREVTGARIDWYGTGSSKVILHLGLSASRRRVDLAIANLRDYPGVTVRRTYPRRPVQPYWQK